jgi:hypothetical protein
VVQKTNPRAAIQSPLASAGGRRVRGEGPKPKSFPKNPYPSVFIRVHPWFKKPTPRRHPIPPRLRRGRGVRGEGPKPKSFPKIRAYLYSSVVQKTKPHAVIQSHSPPPGESGEGPNPKSFPKIRAHLYSSVVPPSSSTDLKLTQIMSPIAWPGAPVQRRFRTASSTVNNMRGCGTGAILLPGPSWSLPEQQPTFTPPGYSATAIRKRQRNKHLRRKSQMDGPN